MSVKELSCGCCKSISLRGIASNGSEILASFPGSTDGEDQLDVGVHFLPLERCKRSQAATHPVNDDFGVCPFITQLLEV
jgi:hypothetical protein